jgi:anti-anti-sigma regulatory factor
MSKALITTRQRDNYIGLLEIRGDFTSEDADKLEKALSEVIGHGYRWVLVDCQKLDFLDLTCAQALVCNLARLQICGGNLFLHSLSPGLWALLKERYELSVAVAENEEKARQHCARGEQAMDPIPPQKLWLWASQHGDLRVIELLGSLYDEADITLLRGALQGASKVILDCARLVSLSTAGLGCLVGHFRQLSEMGGGLRLVNPSGAAAHFLTLAGPLFPPQASLETAAASF